MRIEGGIQGLESTISLAITELSRGSANEAVHCSGVARRNRDASRPVERLARSRRLGGGHTRQVSLSPSHACRVA